MRTTLELPDPLFREVKARAAQSGLKLKELLARYIEAGLRSPSLPTTTLPRTRRIPPVAIKRAPGAPSIPALTNAQIDAVLTAEDAARALAAWGTQPETK